MGAALILARSGGDMLKWKRGHLVYVPTYRDRDVILARMGYESYSEYLNSALWARIRAEAYAEHGPYCWLCRDKAVHLHHKSYSEAVMRGNNIDALVPLCEKCHKKVEFKKTGAKRTLVEVQKTLTKLLERVM